MKNSLWSSLKKVASGFYRSETSGVYYGVKYLGRVRAMECLDTTDRKIGERRMREWLGKLEKARKSGLAGKVAGGRKSLTIGELVERYLATRTAVSESTKVGERSRVKMFREEFGVAMDRPVTEVRNGDLAAWLAKVSLDGEGKLKRASTRNQYRAFLRALMDFAVAEGEIEETPFDAKICKKAKKDAVLRLIPSREEFDAIIMEIRLPRWVRRVKVGPGYQPGRRRNDASADYCFFLGGAGVGQAEASALTWADVGEEEIRFMRAKTRTYFYVPVFAWLRPLLARMRSEAGGLAAKGNVFKARDVKHSLASACKRCGLPSFTPRNLRAMRIKRLWEAGVDVKEISKWQGHRDGGALIMSTYTEVFGSTSNAYSLSQLKKAEMAEAHFAGVVVKADFGGAASAG